MENVPEEKKHQTKVCNTLNLSIVKKKATVYKKFVINLTGLLCFN